MKLESQNDEILPITYINSSAAVKAKVGQMGGMVCTSSNAYKIIEKGLKSGKKYFLFLIDVWTKLCKIIKFKICNCR